jgi:hypothetical protein
VQTDRPLKQLALDELQQLMQLAIEAAAFARVFSQRVVESHMALAAECGFELWSRAEERARARRSCGRSVGTVNFDPRHGQH